MIKRKHKEPKAPTGQPPDAAFERCILCGRPTEILITQPVDNRHNYVVGLGQLCEECGRMIAMERDPAILL